MIVHQIGAPIKIRDDSEARSAFSRRLRAHRNAPALAKLSRLPRYALVGPVRHVPEATVRRIRDGHVNRRPKTSENSICRVQPHGKASRETLPVPKDG